MDRDMVIEYIHCVYACVHLFDAYTVSFANTWPNVIKNCLYNFDTRCTHVAQTTRRAIDFLFHFSLLFLIAMIVLLFV